MQNVVNDDGIHNLVVLCFFHSPHVLWRHASKLCMRMGFFQMSLPRKKTFIERWKKTNYPNITQLIKETNCFLRQLNCTYLIWREKKTWQKTAIPHATWLHFGSLSTIFSWHAAQGWKSAYLKAKSFHFSVDLHKKRE